MAEIGCQVQAILTLSACSIQFLCSSELAGEADVVQKKVSTKFHSRHFHSATISATAFRALGERSFMEDKNVSLGN